MSTPTTSTPTTVTTPSATAEAVSSATPEAVTPAAAARMFKIKHDGQESELSEADMIKFAQLGKSSESRFQEAAKTRREAEQIIKFAQENPQEFFKKTGKNARQWAEEYLLGEIQREQMSPEQKKAYENEQLLRQYEAQEKAIKAKAEQERQAALEQQHMKSYDEMFVKALTESGLPKTPYTVMRMAQLTQVSQRKGLNLDPSQLAKIVREDYLAEQKALFGASDGDALIELLGKEGVKKLSKAQLAKYKSTRANTSAPPKREESKDPVSNQVSSWKAFQKKNRGLI